MARQYKYRWVPYMEQQYNSLPREGKGAVNRALQQLMKDPHKGTFRRREYTWTFSTSDVIVYYTIEDNLLTITLFRLAWMK